MRERHFVVPEPRVGGLGDVREHALVLLGGDHQPGGDVRGYHDRLPVRGVFLGVSAGARVVRQALPRRRARGRH